MGWLLEKNLSRERGLVDLPLYDLHSLESIGHGYAVATAETRRWFVFAIFLEHVAAAAFSEKCLTQTCLTASQELASTAYGP